jgi:uncharacterized protein YuzE
MTHDPEADAAFVYLAESIPQGGVAQTKLLDHYTPGASVILHFDANNRLLGVELLGFSRLVPEDVARRVNGSEG